MRTATLLISFLAALAAMRFAPTDAEAQATSLGTLKIGNIVVANGGELLVTPDPSGIAWGVSGTANCVGAVQFHVNSSGTANSAELKERFLSVLMAAQLSSRKITVNMQRNAANQCFGTMILLSNAI